MRVPTPALGDRSRPHQRPTSTKKCIATGSSRPASTRSERSASTPWRSRRTARGLITHESRSPVSNPVRSSRFAFGSSSTPTRCTSTWSEPMKRSTESRNFLSPPFSTYRNEAVLALRACPRRLPLVGGCDHPFARSERRSPPHRHGVMLNVTKQHGV